MYASFIIGIRPYDTTEPIFAILDVVLSVCSNEVLQEWQIQQKYFPQITTEQE